MAESAVRMIFDVDEAIDLQFEDPRLAWRNIDMPAREWDVLYYSMDIHLSTGEYTELVVENVVGADIWLDRLAASLERHGAILDRVSVTKCNLTPDQEAAIRKAMAKHSAKLILDTPSPSQLQGVPTAAETMKEVIGIWFDKHPAEAKLGEADEPALRNLEAALEAVLSI